MIRGIETFDPGGSAGFGTWLVTIAKNCCVDHLRRSRVLPEDIDALPLPGGVDPAEAVERKLQCEELLAEPEALPAEEYPGPVLIRKGPEPAQADSGPLFFM